MQLSPRYGTDPLITLDGPPDAILGPLVRQQARFVAELGKLDEDGWTERSRCDAWTNRDVIVHLDTATSFFAFAIRQGLAGEPTQFLATFDPVASPAQMVADAGAVSSEEVLAKFAASSAAMAELLGSLDDDDWTVLAEAPPGHLSVAAVAHHSLWDSWVHERDVFLPLGIVPDEEPDEITASLRYVAALSPAFAVHHGRAQHGALVVDVERPDLTFAVEMTDHVAVVAGDRDAELRLTGDAVPLLEALSLRAPLDQTVPEGSAWMLAGLAETFDAVP
jgi:uncharacterized protein (TIGR03083 family)